MARKKQVDRNKVYHNTLLLLRRYRDVVWSLAVATTHLKREFKHEFGTDIDEFLDSLYNAGAELSGTDIEERAKSISRSNKMLKLVDSAANTMREKNKNGEIYYQVIYHNYLSQYAYRTNEEITAALCEAGFPMCRKTMTAWRAEAVECMGALLWGYTTQDCREILEQFIEE